jgi:8-oxo-dGTP pyrophosphatase MutT (NUDIX family)
MPFPAMFNGFVPDPRTISSLSRWTVPPAPSANPPPTTSLPMVSRPTSRILPDLEPYRGAQDDPDPREGGWVAAVSVILRWSEAPRPGGTGSLPDAGVSPGSAPELLLIRRAPHDRDPWSGHMALPGGRRDPGDASLLETARRETREEVDISLAHVGQILGRLDAVAPLSPSLPPLTILPLVFTVPGSVNGRIASPGEVAELHWVSLAYLRNPASRTSFRYPGAGGLAFPAFDVEGRSVWGLTHRVLTDLLARLPAPGGSEPPR